MNQTSAFFYRLWEQGQDHLAAGRYVAARTLLERAADMAWRTGDVRSLTRLYLPLLETRRQIRLRAVEGAILIGRGGKDFTARELQELAAQGDATVVLSYDARALRFVSALAATSRRVGHCVETLVLLNRGNQSRVASPFCAASASGLPVEFTQDPAAGVPSSTDPNLVLPLPLAGKYTGRASGLGALARESLLIAWEALALRWQSRHLLPRRAGPWEELQWLRQALRVDPACEPITMRLIALAEGIERKGR